MTNVNEALAPLLVSIGELHPDKHNARAHSDRSIEAIKTSLSEFGQQKPIVALHDGTVIAGNGTLEAARQLGWSEIAAVRFDDAEKARAFALADNRATELSSWNIDELLNQIGDYDAKALNDVGFTEGEMQDLFDYQKNPFTTMKVSIDELKAHPRNYQAHPDDQLAHIIRSIEAHGFYRNVVIARDNTILAGHGVVQAAKKMGKMRVPVIRLDLDPNEPRALKVLTSDNEISNLAETDDRALTGLLKDIMQTDQGLLGTGFNEQQLAALVFVTRPQSEVADIEEAADWIGMPEYEPGKKRLLISVSVADEKDRDAFLKLIGATRTVRKSASTTISIWWPEKELQDPSSIRFVDGADDV